MVLLFSLKIVSVKTGVMNYGCNILCKIFNLSVLSLIFLSLFFFHIQKYFLRVYVNIYISMRHIHFHRTVKSICCDALKKIIICWKKYQMRRVMAIAARCITRQILKQKSSKSSKWSIDIVKKYTVKINK